jgi:4-amino-4-deoxy-L-arabinose transferase-like glycosyltransferase
MQSMLEKLKTIGSKTAVQFVLFSSLLWLVFVHLHINRHLRDMITGLHYWRKSDTYAQISNYYYNGLNFFDHSIYYNQLESGGRAVAEFPIFYYFIAIQQSIFGNYSIIAKLNWMLLLVAGLFALFKIVNHYLKNFLLSFIVAVSVFLSPVFSIYSIDYLPDPVALNFIFIGLWFLLKSTLNAQKKTLFWALFFISIAGMIKPFFLIPFIAILICALINKFWIKNDQLKFNWFWFTPFITVGIWYFYTQWYNTHEGSDYFLSKPRPIWKYSSDQISTTLEAVATNWIPVYLHPGFLWAFLILIVTNLFWWTKKTLLISTFYLLCILGSFLFTILFFNMFQYHDYYIYPIIFALPLTIGLTIYRLTLVFDHRYFKIAFTFMLPVLLYFGLNYTWEKMNERRKNPNVTSTFYFENYQNTEPFLSNNGVAKDAYVVAFSDKSPTFALSLMNRRGWSGFQTMTYHWYMSDAIEKGADFLILNARVPKMSDSTSIHGYLNYPVADSNDLFIYDLKPYRTN